MIWRVRPGSNPGNLFFKLFSGIISTLWFWHPLHDWSQEIPLFLHFASSLPRLGERFVDFLHGSCIIDHNLQSFADESRGLWFLQALSYSFRLDSSGFAPPYYNSAQLKTKP
jgi:hypothetical protein